MDNVFSFRNRLIEEYQAFSRGFTLIAAPDILQEVERQYAAGRYWPEPLLQINPNYKRKGSVQELTQAGELHPTCAEIFQFGMAAGQAQPLILYTAYDLKPWAEHLGYDGPPFAFDPDRRAQLRAELDAYYARLYGLTRDELRYILDPADVMGEDYPPRPSAS